MSFTSNPSSHRPALPRAATARRQETPSDGASPWLWATLVALLVVIPSWWWARHADESFATDTAPAPAASRQILPSADGPHAMTMVPHQPARAPVSSGEAIPLPGNALPTYPAELARAGLQGSRTARLQLDVQGRVNEVTIVERAGSNDPRLDAAVVRSLQQWRFEPATRDGHAVVSTVQVPVEFSAQR
ncbi:MULTISPECIES: energy transducer TonB [Xanthomonas]|uniref:Cell envelope biogenesis protein TonB n=1 Tax=Xanthomonas cucurbitae TaxID=56453 RepID=A0A2S7DY65_9XANT|nr:energy transducer TonB [Xanthomonas cucurbitae]PPU78721.1 cell envelope biogenesis protein TonB [Xanthomonas cucurbitae]QHG86789.1 energy transducer TonB [Xanthomonas cucurbitae]WDM69118.1 energy transducer TonB [Xanthomonas cucurbitae]WDM72989.1 energy transducer TonB [Xanthomonas cucurbitae]WDM76698.1 energy transducer TonB [Xanthomonas cucurbitae]